MGVLSVMHVQSHWNTEKSLNLNVALQTPSRVLWVQIYIILRLFSKSYTQLLSETPRNFFIMTVPL